MLGSAITRAWRYLIESFMKHFLIFLEQLGLSINTKLFTYHLITSDEFTWTALVVGDAIWNRDSPGAKIVLCYSILMPVALFFALKLRCVPGDSQKPGNNIILVDLRQETNASDDVKEVIANPNAYHEMEATGRVETLLEKRGHHSWVRHFESKLAPGAFKQTLEGKEWRNIGALAQGSFYCGKAEIFTPIFVLISVILAVITSSAVGCLQSFRVTAILIIHINQEHILRDHSISGLTHHIAQNAGEFDKQEFREVHVKGTVVKTIVFLMACAFRYAVEDKSAVVMTLGPHVIKLLATDLLLQSVVNLALANHTICHTNVMDVNKNVKGGTFDTARKAAWKMLLGVQSACAKAKLVCSIEYHKQHHFHTEMSNPAILAPLDEFLTSMALHELKDRTLGNPKDLAKLSTMLQCLMLACVGLAIYS